MGCFHDYRTGDPVEIDTKAVRLISANEAIDATVLRVEDAGRTRAYLLRDSLDQVRAAFR